MTSPATLRPRSLRFTLRQLEYFVAVGETGSITRASEQINISQPSISTAIADLEHDLDVKLFVRHHAQGLSPTSAGRHFLIEAKWLLEQANAFYDVAARMRNVVSGILNVGCLTTLAPVFLPELLLSFRSAYPETQIRPVCDNQDALLEQLGNAAIDVVITYDLKIPPEVSFTPLAKLPAYVLVGEGHPLRGRASVTLDDLAAEPLILLDLPQSREYFLALFSSVGLKPNVAMRLQQSEVIRSLVANGYGYTLANVVPRSEKSLDGHALSRVALAGDHRAMVMGIATLSRMPKARLLTAFETHAKSLLSESEVVDGTLA